VLPIVVMVLLLLLAGVVRAVLPAGFEDEGVSRIPDVVDLAFAPPNRMLAVTKAGVLFVSNLEDDSSTENPQEALDLRDRVCDNGERG